MNRGFLTTFPAFFAGLPPDMEDEDGVPLLEGSTRLFKGHVARIQYAPCPYAGSRAKHTKPMNVGALRPLLKNAEVWKDAVAAYVLATRDRSPSTYQSLYALAESAVWLPYVEKANGRPISREMAMAFKFFRGLAYYAKHRLVHEDDNTKDLSMWDYADHHELLVGEREVCPASSELIRRSEQEILSLLSQTPAAKPQHFEPAAMLQAVNLNVCLTAFCVMMSLHAIALCRAARQDAGDGAAVSFECRVPIPFILTAADVASSPGRVPAFLRGLRRLVDAGVVKNRSSHVATQLLSHFINGGASSWMEADAPLTAAESINSEVLALLRIDERPAAGQFRNVVQQIVWAAPAVAPPTVFH